MDLGSGAQRGVEQEPAREEDGWCNRKMDAASLRWEKTTQASLTIPGVASTLADGSLLRWYVEAALSNHAVF